MIHNKDDKHRHDPQKELMHNSAAMAQTENGQNYVVQEMNGIGLTCRIQTLPEWTRDRYL
jgi:hypothetical protein